MSQEIYYQYEPTRIEIARNRLERVGNFYHYNMWRPYSDDTWLRLGDYMSLSTMNDVALSLTNGLMVKAKSPYVIKAEAADLAWSNQDGGRTVWGQPYMEHRTPQLLARSVNGVDGVYYPLGSYLTYGTNYGSVALIRSDLLLPRNAWPAYIWNDDNSHAYYDGSALTYWDYVGSPDERTHPGFRLVVLALGWDTSGDTAAVNRCAWVINPVFTYPYPRFLDQDIIQIYTDAINVLVNKYTDIINYVKTEIEKNKDPSIDSIKSGNDRKVTSLTNLINTTKTKYDVDFAYNKYINEVQDTYNHRYNFMNGINLGLNKIRNKEQKIIDSQMDKLIDKKNTIGSQFDLDDTSISNVDNNLSNSSKNESDLIKQYRLQRNNDRVLDYIAHQKLV